MYRIMYMQSCQFFQADHVLVVGCYCEDREIYQCQAVQNKRSCCEYTGNIYVHSPSILMQLRNYYFPMFACLDAKLKPKLKISLKAFLIYYSIQSSSFVTLSSERQEAMNKVLVFVSALALIRQIIGAIFDQDVFLNSNCSAFSKVD